jgi:hypothetical protein
MEQMTWPFDVSPDTMVVTTTYVTRERKDVLYVTHEFDRAEGIIWQFHCGNGLYSPDVLQLVRLDEILVIDPGLLSIAKLPVGYSAKRATRLAPWETEKEGS